jgi:hypothetical protein
MVKFGRQGERVGMPIEMDSVAKDERHEGLRSALIRSIESVSEHMPSKPIRSSTMRRTQTPSWTIEVGADENMTRCPSEG